MKKINLILMIIGALILLGLGYSFGLSSGQKAIEETETPLTNLLESKVIGEINTVASGKVTEISGRNLTLNQKGDTFTLLISEKATINRLILITEITGVPQPATVEDIEFNDIQIGDQVEISCLLKADGSLEGKVVTVLERP